MIVLKHKRSVRHENAKTVRDRIERRTGEKTIVVPEGMSIERLEDGNNQHQSPSETKKLLRKE